jgi:cyclophilin family peptidyl-prolyl cis-trans isomerase
MKRISLAGLALLATTFVASAQDAQTPTQICDAAVPAQEPASREFAQAEQVLEASVDYRAILCTEAGPVYVDLLENYAPVTVNSFVFLAQNGYYNNTTFHRVIQDFMAQGGDPTATGSGGPGYQFQDEFVGFLHFDVPGWLAMANANQPEAGIVGTNGSQFFITTVPTPHLDYRHTIFGEVLEGQENVTAIRVRDPQSDPNPGSLLNTVVIVTDPATVTTTYEVPEHATQEDVVTALSELADLPPGIENTAVTSTTEEATATLPEAGADFLSSHQHEYRVSSALQNCDMTQYPFMTLRYTIDSFATPEDAAAALADGAFSQVLTDQGFTDVTESDTLPYPVHTTTLTACDTPAVEAVTYWQRGHFVVTVDAVIPADSADFADEWLSQVGLIFERELTDALRREIR